jgi:hypothetical protein
MRAAVMTDHEPETSYRAVQSPEAVVKFYRTTRASSAAYGTDSFQQRVTAFVIFEQI